MQAGLSWDSIENSLTELQYLMPLLSNPNFSRAVELKQVHFTVVAQLVHSLP